MIEKHFSQLFKFMLETGHIPEKFQYALGFKKYQVSGDVYDHDCGIERDWVQQ